jgi:predicted N-acetyltransferase YhbS
VNAVVDFQNVDAQAKLLISPRVGEMSAQPTEGGAVPPAFPHMVIDPSVQSGCSTLPPSVLAKGALGISPTRGEIGSLIIGAEQPGDVMAREALLDRAMGPKRKKKSSEKLRRGRKPSEGLALVARDEFGSVVGTVRLWDVAVKSDEARRSTLPPSVLSDISPTRGEIGSGEVRALLLGPLAVDPSQKSAGIGSALMRHAIAEAKRLGHGAILLVGDAPYYARFGFSADKTDRLAMPGPYEKHRFLALELVEGALNGAFGTLRAAGRKIEAQAQWVAA